MKKKKIEEPKKIVEPKKIPLSALHWTNTVTPDLPMPTAGSRERACGWSFNLYRVLHSYTSLDPTSIDPTWSTSISHGTRSSPLCGSQQPIAQFSTRLLALRAMRNALECWVAEKLDEIDRQIAHEEKEPTP